MTFGTATTVIAAEQLCVRREMQEGLQTTQSTVDAEEIEMGTRTRPPQGSRMD